jgi:hypothetical protein
MQKRHVHALSLLDELANVVDRNSPSEVKVALAVMFKGMTDTDLMNGGGIGDWEQRFIDACTKIRIGTATKVLSAGLRQGVWQWVDDFADDALSLVNTINMYTIGNIQCNFRCNYGQGLVCLFFKAINLMQSPPQAQRRLFGDAHAIGVLPPIRTKPMGPPAPPMAPPAPLMAPPALQMAPPMAPPAPLMAPPALQMAPPMAPPALQVERHLFDHRAGKPSSEPRDPFWIPKEYNTDNQCHHEYDTQAAAVAAADAISGTPEYEGLVALIEALFPGVRTAVVATLIDHLLSRPPK